MLQESAPRATGKVVPAWDELVRRLCQLICHFLLSTFSELQDALLALGPFRNLVAYAYAPRCTAAVLSKLKEPQQIQHSFDSLSYHISPESCQLLVHACTHALLQTPDTFSRFTAQLPPVGRILLQTGSEGSGKYQEAIAGAVAKELGAELLVIDDRLLAALAKDALGGSLAQLDGGSEEHSVALLPFLLSFWLSGGKLSFVWDMVQRAMGEVQGPLVVFIRDVEQTICSSFERHNAFVSAFGSATGSARSMGSQPPMVLIGGCSLGDTGSQLTQSSRRTSGSGKSGPGAKPPARPPSGDDEHLPPLLPTAAELGLSVMDEKPVPRKLLPKLFTTRIRLQAPREGPAAVKHQQQLAADAAETLGERNYQALSDLAAARKLTLPPPTSDVYSHRSLSRAQWTKVLSWAVSMQVVIKTKEGRELAAKVAAQLNQAREEAQLQAEGQHSQAACEQGQRDPTSTAAVAAQSVAIRRIRSACGSAGYALDDVPLVLQRAEDAQQANACNREDDCNQLTSTSTSQPQEDGSSPDNDGDGSAGPISSSSGDGVPTSLADSVRQRVQGLPAEALQALAEALHGTAHNSKQQLQAAIANAFARATLDKTSGMALSEQALWYGMRMLEKAGGSMRQQVEAGNAYERRLLPEVIRPEDSEGGFAEVGALEDAKTALREAVQLPLQHPHLFVKGSLAWPCKGVLLFGPPGTGKTLLARAAAAECGASFLAIHPSTVASKWLGDGVRYVRAVFSLAAKLSPCVLFLDEVDALLGRRDSRTEHEALREMKNEFMAQWDGIRPSPAAASERVMVLGATNRPHDLDEAVLRRFSRRIFCDLPNAAAREEILEVMLAGEKLAADVDLDKVGASCEGFSGSDLRALCTAAAMLPVRELLKASGKSASVAREGGTKRAKRADSASADTPAAGPLQDPHVGSHAANGGVNAGDPPPEAHSNGQQSDASSAGPTSSIASASASGSHSETSQANDVDLIPSSASTNPEPGTLESREANGHAPESLPATPSAAASEPSRLQGSGGSSVGAEPQEPASSAADVPGSSTSTTADMSLVPSNGGAADASVSEEAAQQLAATASLRYSAKLDHLIDECGQLAASASSKAAVELRPLTAADFEEARKDVTPSTSMDSAAMEQLKQWNAKFGEKAGRRDTTPHLSYFM